MGTRPLNSEEKADLKKRLKEAKEHKLVLDKYIADLEGSLAGGTAWSYNSKLFKEMCEEVEESARRGREAEKRRDIARYGRVLTHAERQGWVRLPKEVVKRDV